MPMSIFVILFESSLVWLYAQSATGMSTAPVPLNISASDVGLSKDPNLVTLKPSSQGNCGNVTWLNTIQLKAHGPSENLFGGISGAFLNGSLLILVSDTEPEEPAPGMSPDDDDSHWGSGRLVVANLKFKEAESIRGGSKLLPYAVENATIQLLRNRFGDWNKRNYFQGDLESVDAQLPDDVYVGMEHTLVVRRYKNLAATAHNDSIVLGTPTVLGSSEHAKNLEELEGVGANLSKCSSEDGNNGVEGFSLMPGGAILVFCERNLPGGPGSSTIGWLADRVTGEVLTELGLPLPAVPGVPGKFLRVSGLAAIPGTDGVVILFHFWSPKTGNIVRLGYAGINPQREARAKHITLEVSTIVDMRQRDGYILDNFEGVLVAPADEEGSYAIYLLSDNNFNNKYQKTLLLSLYWQSRNCTYQEPQVQQEFVSTGGFGIPAPNESPRLIFMLGAILVSGLMSAAWSRVRQSQRRVAQAPVAERDLLLVEPGLGPQVLDGAKP